MHRGKIDVTIAMLTRNGGPVLERALGALASQSTDRAVEVLAVDSGSIDGTLEVLREHGARVVAIAPAEFNFGATRDLAYQEARGGIVVNLSQDAVPAHDRWLENLIAPLRDERVGVACGASIPDPHRAAPQFPWERNGYFYFTAEMRRFRELHGRGVSFANSAVPKRIWRQFRFQPAVLGEDFQFQRKLRPAGYHTAFPEHAEVLHHHHYTLASLYRRCRHEGQALAQLGCPYSVTDLVKDIASRTKYKQLLREFRRGNLRSFASCLFPVLRPLAVYAGCRLSQPVRAAKPLPHVEADLHE